MEKILSSAMAQEELTKIQARKDEINATIEEKRGKFEGETVEAREVILNDIESLNNELKELNEREKEINSTMDELKKQEERMALAKAFEAKKPEEERNILDSKEYRDAWCNYVKTGNATEVRALATSTSNVPVPTLMQQMIETAWEKFGKFSKFVTKSYVAGYLAIPYEASADGANWHVEGAEAPAEEEITFGQILLQPMMIKKWISLTDELMSLTSEEFMRYIADELVYRVVLLLDHSIINGSLTSGKGVAGIVGNALATKVTAASLGFNTINKAVAVLKTFDNLVVAMNQATFFDTIMGLADTAGRPIYQVATDNTGKPQYFINGIRIEFTDALKSFSAATTNECYAVVGNFAGYRLNLPNGESVETLADPYTLATDDKVRFIGKLFAAGNITRLGHFAYVVK